MLKRISQLYLLCGSRESLGTRLHLCGKRRRLVGPKREICGMVDAIPAIPSPPPLLLVIHGACTVLAVGLQLNNIATLHANA